jgi:hypothetical protein
MGSGFGFTFLGALAFIILAFTNEARSKSDVEKLTAHYRNFIEKILNDKEISDKEKQNTLFTHLGDFIICDTQREYVLENYPVPNDFYLYATVDWEDVYLADRKRISAHKEEYLDAMVFSRAATPKQRQGIEDSIAENMHFVRKGIDDRYDQQKEACKGYPKTIACLPEGGLGRLVKKCNNLVREMTFVE